MKKVITLILIFNMLLPTYVFADNNINENVNSENVIENENIDENVDEITLQESELTDVVIEVSSKTACKIKWAKINNPVKISYTYGDITKEEVVDNSYYVIENIPINNIVRIILSTDELHKTVELECNPSGEYRPLEIKGELCKALKKTDNTSLSAYCSDIKIYNKKGELIGKNNYTLSCNKEIKEAGKYDVTVSFKSDYKGYDDLHFILTVIPNKATIGYNTRNMNENSISFSAQCYNEKCDNIVAEVADNLEFKNAIVKKMKPKTTNSEVLFNIAGLKKNTQYYVRIRVQKNYNGEALYSEPSIIKLHTSSATLVYSKTQKDVKNIISLMKDNKTFTYTFNGYYDNRNLQDFLFAITEDYTQYTERYSRTSTYKDGQVIIKYTVSPTDMEEWTKTTSAINSIVKGAKKKKSIRSKVKYINKRLCNTCKYDYDTYKHNKKASKKAYSSYGCLVRHKAVCSGYAEAFHLICVQCGIQDKYAYSKNHVWNKVKIGKKWYHVDVTWNDCQKRNKTKYLLKKSHK